MCFKYIKLVIDYITNVPIIQNLDYSSMLEMD
jgi:hypothetical protein